MILPQFTSVISCQCGNWLVGDSRFSPLQTALRNATCFQANFHLKRALPLKRQRVFMPIKKRPILERFIKFIDYCTALPCWVWTGSLSTKGYGKFSITRSIWEGAHRVSYRLFIGEIPAGIFVCHRCDNPKCVNPKHLFLGDSMANFRDAQSKQRHAFGDRHGRRKLSEKEAIEIKASNLKGRTLAKEFKVCPATISLIRNNKIWSHLP